jgi:hypothetical protein
VKLKNCTSRAPYKTYGALLILDLNGLRISHISSNFAAFTGLAAESTG